MSKTAATRKKNLQEAQRVTSMAKSTKAAPVVKEVVKKPAPPSVEMIKPKEEKPMQTQKAIVEEKQPKRFLSMFETVKLADYVRLEWKNFEGRTDITFATAATKKLGFPVRDSKIRDVCREMGIERQKPRIYGQGNAKQPAALRADLQTVVEEILKFAQSRGFKSERLEAMAEEFRLSGAGSSELESSTH